MRKPDNNDDDETMEIVLRILSELEAAPSAPANKPQGTVPTPPSASDVPTKVCKDCRERLSLGAFLKDGRGGRRAECAACFHTRYRRGRSGYRHRYSYKRRTT